MDVHQADSVYGVTRRRRKLTEKGREYQQKILFDKRKNLHARMTRKSKLIDDLMYSSKNVTTVREEMHQYDDQFKMLVETHNEYVKLLSEDLHEGEENWFEAVDEVVFTQKHKVYNWMREAENDNTHIFLASYRKEVRNWQKLTFGDAKRVRLFLNFLVKCDGVAKEHNWNAINTPEVICMLVSKLLNALIDR